MVKVAFIVEGDVEKIIGSGDKVQLAKKVSNQGFDIENAANHPECQSARYFVDKIEGL